MKKVIYNSPISSINSNEISNYRLLVLKSALKLEILGMTKNGKSVYSIVKNEFKFKGNKKKVLFQLSEFIDNHIFKKGGTKN